MSSKPELVYPRHVKVKNVPGAVNYDGMYTVESEQGSTLKLKGVHPELGGYSCVTIPRNRTFVDSACLLANARAREAAIKAAKMAAKSCNSKPVKELQS